MDHREGTEDLHELCNKVYPHTYKDKNLLELYVGLNNLLMKQMKIIRGETDE
jgi:hypothetical protein|tara:strand:- start:655 stop:810 length:156 start_codon:yes stop_codon:yes gene_type:complete